MIQIPTADGRYLPSPGSDAAGNLFKTRNLTFDKAGRLRLSHSPRAAMNEDVDADWSNPAVIVYNADADRYLVQTWDQPFNLDRLILAETPVQNADASFPVGSVSADAAWFDGKLAVSEASDLTYYDAGTNGWVDTNISLTSNVKSQHVVVNFLSKSALAVCNVNTVKLYSALSATPTLLETLTIPADFAITSAKYLNGNLYLGTRHVYGGHAALFVWNGEGTGAQNVTETTVHIIHDIEVYDNGIVAFLSNGELATYTGTGFSHLAAFPIFYTDRVLADDGNINIYHNSLKANGDLLYVSFSDPDNSAAAMLNQPAGVWCYDKDIGELYHRYSFSNSLTYRLADPAINTTTNQVTVARVIPTGTEVWYRASTANAALADDTRYFAIYVDSTHVKIAATLADAEAGTAIDFTADDGAAEDWTFFPNIDFGQVIADRPSALCTIDFSQAKPEYGTDLIWSAELGMRDAPSESNPHLGSVSSGVEARGDYESPKAFAAGITATFGRLSLRFAPLADETDAIVIKYRTEDDRRDEIALRDSTAYQITWTSPTTFTTTVADWADAKAWFDAGEPPEVNVLSGAAGGLLAHVTAITESGGTYTVTIDEPYAEYASGDLSRATFRNWRKFAAIAYGDDAADEGYFSENLPDVSGTFIQVKVELRGIGVEVVDLRVDDASLLPARSSAPAVSV